MAEEPKRRRSSVQKETDAIAEIVRVLKPLKPEQREKLLAAAKLILPEPLTTVTGGK